jgi:hypothetical protein
MKITNIQNTLRANYIIPQTIKNNYQTQPQNVTTPQYGKLPTTTQYLAFTGGYSLDLAQTVEHLDKLAEKNSGLYPPQIRNWLGMILEEGNKAKQTLISAHKEYFSSLKDCTTLEKIKENFPEFSEVISAKSIEPRDGTLIDRFQKGELEFFDNDEEDLSVQLIKLYWGEGFSLNDLKRYADGQDFYNTMKRLKIPTASRDYGHILKFSDPKYNERLTAEMTEKRLNALDRRAQIQDGEPVYIKRGPLSEEHKQRISEGLKRYWEENPEKVFEMSERQKNFYKANPEKSEELSRVLRKAWNIGGADGIKKALSKFFKGKKVAEFNPENPVEMTKNQSNLMKEFWAKNEWAKKSFSKNMKYAWKKVKEENVKLYDFDITPNAFKEKFFEWAEENGYNLENLDFTFKVNVYHPELCKSDGAELSKYTPRFIDEYSDETNRDRSRMLANTYVLALIKASKDLKNMTASSKANENTADGIRKIRFYIKESLFEQGTGVQRNLKVFDAHEIQAVYKDVLFMCLKLPAPERFLETFNKQLNNAYNFLDKQPNETVMLDRDTILGVLK